MGCCLPLKVGLRAPSAGQSRLQPILYPPVGVGCHLSRQAGDGVGVLYALADPHARKAIEAMHAGPAHRRTLAALASQAGLSRSSVAQRFRERVGETPVGSLTQWRMMLARDRLTDGRDSPGTIASARTHTGCRYRTHPDELPP